MMRFRISVACLFLCAAAAAVDAQHPLDVDAPWAVLLLGTEDGAAVAPRVRATKELLDTAANAPRWLMVSGNSKKKTRKLGVEATTLATQVRPALRGGGRRAADVPHVPLLQEHASNNTAQNLVCVQALLQTLGMDTARTMLHIVTNRFHAPRVRRMVQRLPYWAARDVRIVEAEDPKPVKWREDAEIFTHLPHVQRDLQEALRLQQEGGCHTTTNSCG